MGESLIQSLVRRHGIDKVLATVPAEKHEELKYEWRLWGRPEQLLPDDKRIILIMAGRRFGKTRCAAEWVRRRVEGEIARNLILVAPTHNDMVTDMLEGPSGLITISPPWNKPEFRPTDNTLNWKNGARAVCLTAERPERTRGKEFDTIWCDEIAVWRYPHMWDLLQFAGGGRPMRYVVTSTPKPTPLVKQLIREADLVVRGSTFDNSANLDKEFLSGMRKKFEGTRLGRQELYAELLEDTPGALWKRPRIDALRVFECPKNIVRTVVAVDPSGGKSDGNDAQGIVVACRADDGHAYVLSDNTCKLSPDGWGRASVSAAQVFSADRIIGERNFGGDMVEHVVQTAAHAMGVSIGYSDVTASRGKIQRAEPVAALYEQGRVHHVGCLNELEDEMCQFVPGAKFEQSPNRTDALVFALTELMLGESSATLGEVNWKSPRRTF